MHCPVCAHIYLMCLYVFNIIFWSFYHETHCFFTLSLATLHGEVNKWVTSIYLQIQHICAVYRDPVKTSEVLNCKKMLVKWECKYRKILCFPLFSLLFCRHIWEMNREVFFHQLDSLLMLGFNIFLSSSVMGFQCCAESSLALPKGQMVKRDTVFSLDLF